LAIATVVAITLGALTYRTRLPRVLVLGGASVILTIPSFALFGLLLPLFGLGATPSIVALTLYALLPIIRNTVVGLRGVDPAVTESAIGMGMGFWRRLRIVDLPLAWPVVLAGVRVSAQILLGVAAIAATIGGPGLGNLILSGLDRVGTRFAVPVATAGVLGVVVLAVLFDLAFVLVARLTTSRGTRD
ncbi:MAG TPA: ABC transporter permease, partial [Mycobacteriales bacterium]|nr:ABC transporter permease [Mycobacteriales bacterium]